MPTDFGALNTAEALRLSQRGVHRDAVVVHMKAVKERIGTVPRVATAMNIGESTFYNVVAGSQAISNVLLTALYGPTGRTLLARHEIATDPAKGAPRPVSQPASATAPPPPRAAKPAPAAAPTVIADTRDPATLPRSSKPIGLLDQIEHAMTKLADLDPAVAPPGATAAKPTGWRSTALAAIAARRAQLHAELERLQIASQAIEALAA